MSDYDLYSILISYEVVSFYISKTDMFICCSSKYIWGLHLHCTYG